MVNGHQRPSNEVSRRAINSNTVGKYDGYIIISDFLVFFNAIQVHCEGFYLFCPSSMAENNKIYIGSAYAYNCYLCHLAQGWGHPINDIFYDNEKIKNN